VSDITAGVCTTTLTQGIAVGKLVRFNGGGTTGTNTYEVTALTADTSFTINDTSITDATAVTCDEAVPAITSGTNGPDGMTKTSTLSIYGHQQDSTRLKGILWLEGCEGSSNSRIP